LRLFAHGCVSMVKRTCKQSDFTLDVAVVGGGLCGLSLARQLLARGLDVHVFEARERWGGRIAISHTDTDTRFDLGATWYWPTSQPLMTQLVRELGLSDFAQHDSAEVLVENLPNQAARRVRLGPVHAGARRLYGGIYSLIEAMLRELPNERLHASHTLRTLHKHSSYVALQFLTAERSCAVQAKRVVLAMPPRLVAERIQFEPATAVDAALRYALQEVPTWMATQARAALPFERAEWRKTGHSGNAFVLHDRAVLRELFDASEGPQAQPALGAFLALAPSQRDASHTPWRDTACSQVVQLFELTQRPTTLLYRDWATEPYTCSHRDLTEHSLSPTQPVYGAPSLQRARWDHRLYFGGTETADIEGGYMEGALHAAARIAREILGRSKRTTATPKTARATVLHHDASTRDRFSLFDSWLREQREPILEDYKRRVETLLPSPSQKQLTQRALLDSVQHLFSTALEQLQHGPPEVHPGRDAALTSRVHATMREFLGSLVVDMLEQNRNAPTLSALPTERRPSRAYTTAMLRAVYAEYGEFARKVTQLLNHTTHASTDADPEPGARSAGLLS